MKSEFPFFINNSETIYLDNAATTQKPKVVIDSITKFYEQDNYPIDGLQSGTVRANEDLNLARIKVKEFLNIQAGEVIFTSGATESLNLLANGLSDSISEYDEIWVSELEHHANILPWQRMSQNKATKLKYIPFNIQQMDVDWEWVDKNLNPNLKIISITHLSNTLGLVVDIARLVKIVRSISPECIIIVDGAQAVAHLDLKISDIGCDAYIFSTHKIYGPLGHGVLWAKDSLLTGIKPWKLGGKMIKNVSYNDFEAADLPYRLEAGTPNIAGAVGLAAALSFTKQNFNYKKEQKLLSYAIKQLSTIPKIRLYLPKNHIAVVSFIVEDINSYDIGMALAGQNVVVRVGSHCTQLLLNHLGIDSTIRISLGIYNDTSDIDNLVKALQKSINLLR